MEALNRSTSTNDSSFLHNVSTDKSNVIANNTAKHMDVGDIFIFSLCVLGFPGNLLVIAVYAQMMTSSIKVYMFALAVADSVVCVCGVVLLTVSMDLITTMIVGYSINTSITFSMFLLVFVSIERVIAVTRPHTFDMTVQRAKKYLLVIAFATVIFGIVNEVARIQRYDELATVVLEITISVSVFTMTVCYIVLVATLMKKHVGSKYHIKDPHPSVPSDSSVATISSKLEDTSAAENNEHIQTPGTSSLSIELDIISREQNNGSRTVGTTQSLPTVVRRRTIGTQANVYKNVTLLFIITVVFTACWLPSWIAGFGVYIPKYVQRVFIVNSVVNPFIYGVASAMFREDVRQFYRQTHAKLSGCCRH